MLKKVDIINIDSSINKHKCVLCAVDTPRGREIAKNMLNWLSPIYEVHVVWHDGSQYEYPGLKYLQDLCINTNEPCLYLHTRGAFNYHKNTTPFTHRMWQVEFGEKREKYFDLVNTDIPSASCPFTGRCKHTWYNGFVVNSTAMKAIQIKPERDRMIYERIFMGSNVTIHGTIMSNIDWNDLLTPVRVYIRTNYR